MTKRVITLHHVITVEVEPKYYTEFMKELNEDILQLEDIDGHNTYPKTFPHATVITSNVTIEADEVVKK